MNEEQMKGSSSSAEQVALASELALGQDQHSAGLTAPYRPVAIHYTEADALEYVERDVPTFARRVHPSLDVLVAMDSREPIGWRIYGWSRIAPPAAGGPKNPPDEPNTESPQ